MVARREGAVVEHYHSERNHQGLANVIPFPAGAAATVVGRVYRRGRLGGLLSFYLRKAA
jgi:putative transposase